ncbi:hypothetical protein V3C99_017473 [Haemonchus contortus]
MEDNDITQFSTRPVSAYNILLEYQSQIRHLVSDGDVRCILRPNAMAAYCEQLLKTRSADELSLPFGEFHRQELLNANSKERTKFEVFWNEVHKYIIHAMSAIDEMTTGQILGLICQANDIPSSVTFHVDFPCPPPSSCFMMYSKQEHFLNKHLTDEEIKGRWDAMLPKHRIPLFEQYKQELSTFVENLNNFLLQTSNLSEKQKLHTKNIMKRTSAAIDQVNEILKKLRMEDFANSTSALKCFKQKVGTYYNDIIDEAEREEIIQKEFNALPKRVIAWLSSAHNED